MEGSDVISVHAPLNARTNGLIGKAELALMKRSAYIINIGRGGIVNEEALAEAIDKEAIAGAALDAYVTAPLPSSPPLLHSKQPERLRHTPHVGWGSQEALDRLVEGIAKNIETYLAA